VTNRREALEPKQVEQVCVARLLDWSSNVDEFEESVDRLRSRFGGTVSYLLPVSEFCRPHQE